MEIFGIGICAICGALLAAVLKKSNREYAIALALCAGVVLLFEILEQVRPLIDELEGLASGIFAEYLTVMLKAVGIALAGQFAAQVCKDAGEGSLAYTVELAAKVGILLAALPVFRDILEYLGELLAL